MSVTGADELLPATLGAGSLPRLTPPFCQTHIFGHERCLPESLERLTDREYTLDRFMEEVEVGVVWLRLQQAKWQNEGLLM